MKSIRFIIILSFSLFSALGAMGLENSNDTWYQRMQSGAQQRLGSAWTLAKEQGTAFRKRLQDPAFQAEVRQRSANVVQWAKRNKRAIIAATAAAAVFLGGREIRARGLILRTFKDNNVEVDNLKKTDLYNYCLTVGRVALRGSSVLKSYLTTPANKEIYDKTVQANPGFQRAIDQLSAQGDANPPRF